MCGNLYTCYAVFQEGKDTIGWELLSNITDNLLYTAQIMTNSQETTITIEERIEQARKDAQNAGEQFGKTSPEYIVAMDTLEELHQEAGHQKAIKPKNSLEVYCSDNPDAPECLIYED